MVEMQRKVLRALAAGYDRQHVAQARQKRIKDFIAWSMPHHVAHALQPRIPLHTDALLMSLLRGTDSMLCARAVTGIGECRLLEAIQACENRRDWLEVAQMCFALSTVRGQVRQDEWQHAWAARMLGWQARIMRLARPLASPRCFVCPVSYHQAMPCSQDHSPRAASCLLPQRAGQELSRAYEAIGKVQPESAESRALEARVVLKSIWVTQGGGAFQHGSHAKEALVARLDALVRASEAATNPHMSGSAKFEMLCSYVALLSYRITAAAGAFAYTPMNQQRSQELDQFVATAWTHMSGVIRKTQWGIGAGEQCLLCGWLLGIGQTLSHPFALSPFALARSCLAPSHSLYPHTSVSVCGSTMPVQFVRRWIIDRIARPAVACPNTFLALPAPAHAGPTACQDVFLVFTNNEQA